MTNDNTAVTAHGEIEYETVTCDSCGNDVLEEDAYHFAIGGYKEKFGGEVRFKERNTTLGWACEYCHETGPIGYPTQSFFAETDTERRIQYVAVATLLLIIFGISLLI